MKRGRTLTTGVGLAATLSMIVMPSGVAVADDGRSGACRPTITALPLPAGEVSGDVLAVTEREAVGFVADPAQHQHVALWRRVDSSSSWAVRDLGDLGLADSGGLSATGVNPAGVVSIGVNTGAAMAGWVYAAGVVHQLKDFAGGTFAYARDINDAGVITGEALDAAGNDFAARWSHWWSAPVRLDPAAGMDGSYGQGINNRGDVVGGSFSFGPAPTVATRWSRAGVAVTLATFGADAQASDSNDAGRIVGDVITSTGKRAAVWDRSGEVTNLGVFAGDAFSRAIGVSAAGAVVGFEGINFPPPAIPVRHLLYWPGSGPVRSLLPLSGNWADGAYSHAIDNHGNVFGASAPMAGSMPVPTVWTCALAQSFVPAAQ
jgi:hypothetical protein